MDSINLHCVIFTDIDEMKYLKEMEIMKELIKEYKSLVHKMKQCNAEKEILTNEADEIMQKITEKILIYDDMKVIYSNTDSNMIYFECENISSKFIKELIDFRLHFKIEAICKDIVGIDIMVNPGGLDEGTNKD